MGSPGFIQPRFHIRIGQNGFDFGGKEQTPVMKLIEQGLHPDPVPGHKQPSSPLLPDGKRKNPVQLLDAPFPKLRVGMEKHFRVRMPQKGMSLLLKLPTQFLCIIKLPVVDEDVGFSCPGKNHGLLSAQGVDDRQSAMEQGNIILCPNSAAIRPTTVHGGKHGSRGVHVCLCSDDPGDCAHMGHILSKETQQLTKKGNINHISQVPSLPNSMNGFPWNVHTSYGDER